MKIGYDAKRAFHNSRGLGFYSRNLISGLIQLYPENEYSLFGSVPKSGDNFEWLKTVKSQIEIVSPKHTNKIYQSFWRSRACAKDIFNKKVDVYHGLSHEIPVGLKPSKVKTVVTVHDLLFLRYKEYFSLVDRKIYTSKIEYSCANADRIIAISEQTKEDLINFLDVPESKINVLYQSCSPLYYTEESTDKHQEVRLKYNLPQNFFLFVGALVPHKNLKQVIKALTHLKPERRYPLIVIGKGHSFKSELIQYATKFNVEKNIRFIDYVSNEDMPSFYQLSEMLIWPSLFEGFGIPIIEALFSKTPVITSNMGVFPEVGGPSSLYINPHISEEISEAINLILDDQKHRETMINSGFEFVQKFHRENTTKQMMEFYKQL